MSTRRSVESKTSLRAEVKIEALEQQARDLANSVETLRQETLEQSNARITSRDAKIAALEQRAHDLAYSVESVRRQTLAQSNEKIEGLEQKNRAFDIKSIGSAEKVQEFIADSVDLSTDSSIIGQDLDGTILLWNEGAARLYGYTEIEVIGVANCSILHTPADVEAGVPQEIRNKAHRDGKWDGVIGRVHRSGRCFTAHAVVTPWHDPSGQIVGFVLVSKTVSEELRLVEQRSEIKFRLAMDAAPSAMVMVNHEGKIVLVNAQTEGLFGYHRDELLGQPIELMVPEGSRAGHPANIMNFMANTTVRPMGAGREVFGRRKDGSEFPVEIGLNPLKTDGGNFVLSSIVDITERKLAEKLRRQSREDLESRVRERTVELETANSELEAFSYSVSHDLRAPLRAIDGLTYMLLEDFSGLLPEIGKTQLQAVRDNTRKMGQLVDGLLAFSHLGRQALTKQPVDSGEMVRRCLVEMQSEQRGRQIEMVIGELPTCQADPTLLKQVWTNLLSNALKYTTGRQKTHIEIGAHTALRSSSQGEDLRPVGLDDTEMVFFVKDNGAGFDMKYADKLFGVFQRLHRAADYEGTGVGLAIVQRIVNRHGGRVWGQGKLDQGATFSFTLA